MKITAFNPLILSTKADETIELFEALGFDRAHTKSGIEGHITSVDLKYGEQFRVDVANVDKFPQDMTVIRMNLRDFNEAYEFLLSKGFKPAREDGSTTKTGSSEDTLMFSPSGFAICISEHIRK
ncbi:MAG: hypothetical protein Q4A01_08760 [Coriobacteriales bacterium]|nr:hypothetical protein [Coriobacteriales bacterium]